MSVNAHTKATQSYQTKCQYGHTALIADGDGRASIDVSEKEHSRHTPRSKAMSMLGQKKCPHCVTGEIRSVRPVKRVADDADV